MSGIFGTAAGSLLLNKIMVKYDLLKLSGSIKGETLEYMRVEKATLIMPIGILIGMILSTGATIIAYFLSKPANYITFLIGVGFGEFLIFMTIAPTAIAIMGCVATNLRGQANAVSVLVMHSLGDFPSPFLIGALFDTIGKFEGMIVTTGWLIIAVVCWGIGWNIAVIVT